MTQLLIRKRRSSYLQVFLISEKMEWLAVTVGLAAVFVVVLWLYLTRHR